MKKLLMFATLFLVVVISVGVLTAPATTAPGARQATLSAGPADEATLQQDAAMTQAMSLPGAGGPMQTYAIVDAQLKHSRSAAFVLQLQQYQTGIDRMLARPNP